MPVDTDPMFTEPGPVTEELPPVDDSTAAPHGRGDNGTPNAPYGLNLDGTPRKKPSGGRPRKAGTSAPAKRKPTTTSRRAGSNTAERDKRRKSALLFLTDSLIAAPLVRASESKLVARRLGPAQTQALAGDAVIVHHFMPDLADALIVLSQTKPGVLDWMDGLEEKAPYLMLAQVGMSVATAFVQHHLNPDEKLNAAGRTLLETKAAEMVAAVAREHAEAGL